MRWEDIEPDDFIANGLCAGLGVPQLDALVQRASLMLLSTTSLLGFVRASMGVTLLPAAIALIDAVKAEAEAWAVPTR